MYYFQFQIFDNTHLLQPPEYFKTD